MSVYIFFSFKTLHNVIEDYLPLDGELLVEFLLTAAIPVAKVVEEVFLEYNDHLSIVENGLFAFIKLG